MLHSCVRLHRGSAHLQRARSGRRLYLRQALAPQGGYPRVRGACGGHCLLCARGPCAGVVLLSHVLLQPRRLAIVTAGRAPSCWLTKQVSVPLIGMVRQAWHCAIPILWVKCIGVWDTGWCAAGRLLTKPFSVPRTGLVGGGLHDRCFCLPCLADDVRQGEGVGLLAAQVCSARKRGPHSRRVLLCC